MGRFQNKVSIEISGSICLIGALSLLILPLKFGLDGVLFAGPIADGLAALLSVTMVTINFRGLTRLQAEK